MTWINIKDRKPKDDSSVLVAFNLSHPEFNGEQVVDIADYNSKYFQQEGFWINENGGEYSTELKVTHWMPLPEPPTARKRPNFLDRAIDNIY